MGLKAFLFFVLYLLFILLCVWQMPALVEKQVVVSWFAVGGLLLFWVPEMIWRKMRR